LGREVGHDLVVVVNSERCHFCQSPGAVVTAATPFITPVADTSKSILLEAWISFRRREELDGGSR